jgi:hypothetical protein
MFGIDLASLVFPLATLLMLVVLVIAFLRAIRRR